MGLVQASQVLRTKVEDVSAFVTRPEQLPVWFQLLGRCVAANPLTQKGEGFQYELRLLGRLFPGEGHVIRWEPGESLELAAEDPIASWNWSLGLARRGVRSRVTLSVTYTGLEAFLQKGLSPWTMQNLLYTAVRHSLATLGTLVEDPVYMLAATRGRRLAPEGAHAVAHGSPMVMQRR